MLVRGDALAVDRDHLMANLQSACSCDPVWLDSVDHDGCLLAQELQLQGTTVSDAAKNNLGLLVRAGYLAIDGDDAVTHLDVAIGSRAAWESTSVKMSTSKLTPCRPFRDLVSSAKCALAPRVMPHVVFWDGLKKT